MPIDKVGRARQDEGKRRLSVFPDEFGLGKDICDVTLWVRDKFRLTSVHVWIGRHYGHKDRELSGVTVIASPWHPDPITSAVVEAFFALGYAIEDAGADVYGYPVCTAIIPGTRFCGRSAGLKPHSTSGAQKVNLRLIDRLANRGGLWALQISTPGMATLYQESRDS